MAVTSSLTAYEVANSVNIASNTSNLYVKLTATTSGQSYNNYGITSTIYINGVPYYPTHKLPHNTTTTIYENTLTITHNSDGSKTVPISYSIPTGISAGTLTGNTNVTLTKIPRYANITSFSVSKRDETSVTFNWSADATCDYAWYSKDNGSNWYALPSNNIVSGLSPNTSYNFKLRLRRTDSQLTTDSGTYTQTTYNYPYCNSMPNFTIGDSLTLGFYNPLNRTFKMEIIGADGVTQLVGESYNGTSATGFSNSTWQDYLYSTIPNATSGTYKIKVTYGSSAITKTGGTYKIKGTEVPTFTNFTFKDTNTDINEKLGSDQYLVNKLSNLQVSISSANKMVANNRATPKEYVITIDSLTKRVDYSSNGIEVGMGAVSNPATHRLTVKAIDSRGLSTSVYKDVIVYKYEKPVVNVKLTRLNNFETETTLQVDGTFTKINVDGVNKNIFKKVTYRYREKGGTWVDWVLLTTNVEDNTFTCNDVILSLDNTKEFEFEVQALDTFDNNIVTGTVNIGQAVFFISSNKKSCYINGEIVKGSIEVSSDEPTNGELLWIQKSKNLAKVISSTLTDGGLTFTPVTNSELRITGTTTTDVYARIIPSLRLKANRTYTMSINYDASGSFFLYTNKYANVGLSYGNFYLGGGRKMTFTPTQDGEIDLILFVAKSISVTHNLQILIEESPTVTTYEPYVEPAIYVKNNAGNYDEIFSSGVTLYENSSGSNGTITLNETSANFSKIEIHARLNNDDVKAYFSAEFDQPDGKKVVVATIFPDTAWSYMGYEGLIYQINGTTMTVTDKGSCHMYQGSANNFTHDSAVVITKVIGYK